MQVKLSILCTCVIHILCMKLAQLLKLNTLYTRTYVFYMFAYIYHYTFYYKKFSCCCYYFVDNQIIILYSLKMEVPNIWLSWKFPTLNLFITIVFSIIVWFYRYVVRFLLHSSLLPAYFTSGFCRRNFHCHQVLYDATTCLAQKAKRTF